MATTDWTQDAGMTSDTEVDNLDTLVDQAEASATAAASSAFSASTSASSASTSASNAATSETNAAASESAAATSESNASSSAATALLNATSASDSASSAFTSASNAATSESNAATSETNAAAAQTAAEAAQAAAELAESNINEFYLGAQASDPTVDGNGDPVTAGDWYFNTSANETRVYNGSTWQITAISDAGLLTVANNLSDLSSAATARTNLGLGTAATTASTDYATAAQGALADSALQSSDIGVSVQGYDTATAKYDDTTANFTGTLQNGGSNVIVDSDIGSTVQAYDADTAKLDVAQTFTAAQKFTEVQETFVTVGASAIDCSTGTVFSKTLSANTTFTFSNPPATGTAYAFTLKVIQDSTARTVTWPTSVDWAEATAPTLSTGSGDIDVFVFLTHDGGTTWYGFTAGQALA